MNDYVGSLAQQYIDFSAIYSVQTNPGENFGKAMVFVDGPTLSGMWSGTIPDFGTDQELTSQNYGDFVTGTLKLWLDGYFSRNTIANIFITCWDATDTTTFTGLKSAYDSTKYDAYFKTIYTAGLANATIRNNARVTLQEYSESDLGKFTQLGFFAGTSDNLDPESTTSLLYLLRLASGDSNFIYWSSDTSPAPRNPNLDQWGLTLGALNGSGTAIGNALDYIATTSTDASDMGENLSAADVAGLVEQNAGYWATLGNSTGATALYNPVTIKGNYAGARWIVAYMDFVNAIRTIEFLTDPATPQGKRRNNTNYQAILGIVNSTATPFNDRGGIGILQNFTTAGAPKFSDLSGGGDTLIVPNAWSATWLQGIHEVTVQGTLYIQA